jgi:hypothetical protein
MSKPTLFLSFWDICLSNLSEGDFSHRRLPPSQAQVLIAEAQQAHSLLCVSEADLLAPRHEWEAQNHRELCTVLEQHYGITLTLKDFMMSDEEDGLYSTSPLQIAQIRGESKLLVITCNYRMKKEQEAEEAGSINIDDWLVVAPDSVEFHLIEATLAATAKPIAPP